MSLRRLMAAVVMGVLGLVAATAVPVVADTSLTGSRPADSTTTSSFPGQVVLRFDRPVDPDATVIVQKADGALVPTEQARVAGATIRVATVPPTGESGPFTVSYRAVSRDGHPATGQIRFRVADDTWQAAPLPQPRTLVPGSPTTTTPLSSSPSDGVFLALLGAVMTAMIAGLVLVAIRTGGIR